MTAVAEAPPFLPEWADIPPGKPPREPYSCKCPRQWCRVEGIAHNPFMIRVSPDKECGPIAPDSWNLFYAHRWECHHVERCVSCGKTLRRRWQIGLDCPTFRQCNRKTVR